MKDSNFPGVDEIFHALKAEHASMRRIHNKKDLSDGEGNFGIEVRLQVYSDGQWAIHTGASDYDQDHRGYWGSGFIAWSSTDKKLKELAKSLIDDAKENSSDDDEEEEDDNENEEDEPSEPQEGDWVMDDSNYENRGGREVFFEVGGSHKVVCVVEEGENRNEKLKAAMERAGYFPNCWHVSDHGNAHRIDLSKED